VLLLTLFFVPWFSTTGYGRINGHSGDATGWQTYTILRYYMLWCGVGASSCRGSRRAGTTSAGPAAR
jgi:hypothetical protein